MAIERVITWGPTPLESGEPQEVGEVQAGDRIIAVGIADSGSAAISYTGGGITFEDSDYAPDDYETPGVVRATADGTVSVSGSGCTAIIVVYRGLPNTPDLVWQAGQYGLDLPTGTWNYPSSYSSPSGQFTVVRCAVVPDGTSEPIVVSGTFILDAEHTTTGFIAETVEGGPPVSDPSYTSAFEGTPGFYAGRLFVAILADLEIGVQVTDPGNAAPVGSGRYPIR